MIYLKLSNKHIFVELFLVISMRYTVYLLSMFLTFYSLQSQPTLSITSIPQIGEKYTFTYCDTTGVEAGEGGADMNWNFSTLKFLEGEDAVVTNNIVAPQSGIKYSSFPSATYAIESEGGYSYFKVVNNKIERLGTGYEAGEEVLTKSEIIYGLPFEFPNVYEGSFSGSIKTGNIITKRGGKILTIADGFGSIVLPKGSYPNLLRIRIEQVINDTVPPVVPGAPSIISITETVSHIWLNDEYKFGLLNISTITNSQVMQGNVISKTVTKNVTVQDAEPGAEMYLTTPGIISPIEGSNNLKLPFRIEWSEAEVITPGSVKNEIKNSNNYTLQVSGLSDFSDQDLINEYNLTDQTSMEYSEDLFVNDLYIRVQASYADIFSDWSDVTTVSLSESEMSLSTPEIISPLDGSVEEESPIMFAWTESELIIPGGIKSQEVTEVQYYLQIGLLPSFEDNDLIIEFEPTIDSYLDVEIELPVEVIYARVKATYEDIESEWSEVVKVYLVEPQELIVPTLLSPQNGTTELDYNGVLCTWESPNENMSFQFRIISEFMFMELFVGDQNSYTVTDLDPDTEYSWSVRADAMNGDTSEWADNWTFKTKAATSVKEKYFNDNRLIVSPNPATDEANVRFTLNNDDDVRLKVFTIEGNLLFVNNIGIISAGEHNIQLPLDGFPSGAYYIMLEGRRLSLMRSIIVQ